MLLRQQKTKEAYPNLKDWSVETSSSGAMTVALGQAIKNNEDIVITGGLLTGCLQNMI